MALSLDNTSSFYYYDGGGGQHQGQSHGGGGILQQSYDVYGGHAALAADEDAAAATAMASWVQAARGATAYATAESVLSGQQQQHLQHHPLALCMSSAGSLSSCVTAGAEYGSVVVAAVDGGRKRGGATAGQKQPVHHRKSIDTFGQRTSQYRGVTRYTRVHVISLDNPSSKVVNIVC